MSRPKVLSSTGSQVKIDVPPGWFVTISAISRKGYNQLITCDYTAEGGVRDHYLVNKWGQPNNKMRDLDSSEDMIAIVPQERAITFELKAYFSDVASVREDSLKADKYSSSRLNIVGTQKPPNGPKNFPDYSTFLIFVEDSAAQIAGSPEYDDSLITVNVIKGEIPPPAPDTGSQALAQTGKDAVEQFINIYTDPTKPGPTIDPGLIIPPPPRPYVPQLPVCIVGAGVSGLYIAMMLDSLGIKYELMEGSGRTGGRLYTHNFPKNAGKYQYYDVGAMRYPKTSFMTRTFELAQKRLGLNMLPYIRDNDNAFLSYNKVSVTKAKNKKNNLTKEDTFNVSVNSNGDVPETYFKDGHEVFWDQILGDLRQYFVVHPFAVAFKKLKEWEDHSVTSYLLLEKKIPYPVVKWWETMESRTGLFDQSLVETVLASLVFMGPNPADKVEWLCFDGGSEVLHKAMTERISTKPQHYMRTVAVKDSDDGETLTVTFDSTHNPCPSGARTEKKYSHVISTMSFGCLRMVDLDHLQMSYGQRNAIRQLAYTPSVKIGLQFKTAWWEKDKLNIVGGQSSTDRPIRDIVYPSYPHDESHPGNQNSNCMIAAYNGMQDSQRLGGLMKGKDTPEENALLDLVLRDLAAVHQVDIKMLRDQLEDYYPWDFYRDEFQLGAFCQFGPGQFKHTYPYVTQPASKTQRFHFAGDATSTFHGWVAGALNSGWRAVLGMLLAHPELNPNPNEDIIAKFKKEWGDSEEWAQETLAKHTYLARELSNLSFQSI